MKRIWLMGLVSLVIGMLFAGQAWPREEGFYSLSEKVVTPHISWAKPYYKGKTKALIIASRWSQRETVELSERLDLNYTTVFTQTFDRLGYSPDKDGHGQHPGCSQKEMESELAEKLKGDYDLIIIANFRWNSFPKEIQFSILKKVSEGTGLVYTYPFVGEAEMIKNILATKKVSDEEGFISTGIPFKVLPFFDIYPSADLAAKNIISTAQLKEGRIVALSYPDTTKGGEKEVEMINLCLTPLSYFTEEVSLLDYEYYQSLVIKAVLWAAKKEPQVYIKELTPDSYTLSQNQSLTSKIKVNLLNKEKEDKIDLLLSIHDEENVLEAEIKKDLILKPEINTFSFDLPRLKDGLHFIDLFVKKDAQVINWGSTYVNVLSDIRIEKIVLDKEYYEKGETLKGRIILNKEKPADTNLRIKLWDNLGRIIEEREVSLASGQKEAGFEFTLDKPLTILLKVKGEIYDTKGIIQESIKEFTVPNRENDDYTFLMWGGGGNEYVSHQVRRQLSEIGVDTIFTGFFYGPLRCKLESKNIINSNQKLLGYISGNSFAVRSPGKDLVRNPCFTDPNLLKGLNQQLIERTKELRKYGPPAYSLAGESVLSFYSEDYCFSPTCKEDFREYLKKEYGDLKRLNEEWETNYQDWKEIEPITLVQAREKGKYSQWVDHRLHMETVFANFFDFGGKTIQQEDRFARIGFDSPHYTTSFTGYDWSKLMKFFDLCSLYPYPEEWEMVRSFMKKGALTGFWHGGYEAGGLRENEDLQRYYPWLTLLNGFNSTWFFMAYGNAGGGGGSLEMGLAPDLTPFDCLKWISEEVNEIKEGVGKLILDCERENDGIALHYSQASIHASTISSPFYLVDKDNSEAHRNFQSVLEDLDLQYNYLAYSEIEQGKLREKKYKVLILPYSQAISLKETAEMKEFVKEGGVLIADLKAGVMDGHGKIMENGLLDEVFGIRSKWGKETKKAEIVISKGDPSFQFKGKLPLTLLDPEVQLTTGRSLAEAGGIPTVIVNKYGKGLAIYLNFSLEDYKKWRIEGKKDCRNLVRELLKLAGVESRIKISTKEGDLDYETVFFKNGKNEYLGILGPSLGEITPGLSEQDKKPKEVEITLPEKKHLYDIRERKYYGLTDKINTVIIPARAKLYALLPYEILGVDLSLDKNSYGLGEPINYRLNIKTSMGYAAGEDVVRIELYDPEGKLVRQYSDNLLVKEGNFQGKLRLALNDKVGKWKLVAKEVISGKETEKEFQVSGKE